MKAVSLKAVFDSVGYHPHKAQRQIHQAANTARWRTVCAGRRTGKSTLGGHEYTGDAFQVYYNQKDYDKYNNRWECWIVGPEYSDAEKEFRVLYGDLDRLGVPFDKPGTYNDPNGGNMHISLWGGRYQVHAKSAKYPDTLVGEGLRRIIVAEAAKQKPSVWYKYLRPTLADYHGDALFSSTPEGHNWFYDLFMDGVNPDKPEYWSIRMPSWANTVIFPGGRNDPEIVSMSQGMSQEKFNQEIGAEFADFEGAVFKSFDEQIHVGRFRFNPKLPVYLATDYGFTNPNVMLFIQVDMWDTVNVIAEYYMSGRTAGEFAADIQTDPDLFELATRARLLYPDPEDPGASNTLSRALNVHVVSNTGGPLNDRLNLIRRWLRVDAEGKPKLNIDIRCKNLIREMSEYRYPESNSDVRNPQELPMKKDDHAPEALGRFFAGHFEKILDKNTARQRRAITRR